MKSNFYQKRSYFLLYLLVQFSCLSALTQDLASYEKKWVVQGSDTLPHRVLLPLNYDSAKQYPLVFFLHGAGERGRDNEKQLVHGAKLFLGDEARKKFPAIVVFPQCAATDYWSNVLRLHDAKGKRQFHFLPDGTATTNMIMLQQLITYVIATYPVQKEQVYVGGLSMGGMGTYEVVRRMPGIFAAAFAICGGANPETAKKLKKVNWWIFHGAKDDVVPPEASQVIVNALKKAGADVKFTLYPNANHNSWDPVFAEKDLLPWLFAQHK